MTYTQVCNALSSVTYSDAIAHYNLLKQSFLTQYALRMNASIGEAEQIFKEQIIDEINSENIEVSEEDTAIIFNYFSKIFKDKISKSTSEIKRLKKLIREKDKKAKKNYEKMIDEVMKPEEIQQAIFKILRERHPSKKMEGFSVTDILNQIQKYKKRLFLVRKNASSKYYQQTTKGYVREAVVHSAFLKLSEQLGQPVAMHTGNILLDGKQTLYDEFIDFFNETDKSFNAVINDDLSNLIYTGFGVQSKSWRAPWERNNVTQWTRFSESNAGQLKDLLTTLNYHCETWCWINGVLFLEPHLIDAIGYRNVIFVTGGGFNWTSSLIANFRNLDYYFAFVFDKNHKATNQTSWQQINMNA